MQSAYGMAQGGGGGVVGMNGAGGGPAGAMNFGTGMMGGGVMGAGAGAVARPNQPGMNGMNGLGGAMAGMGGQPHPYSQHNIGQQPHQQMMQAKMAAQMNGMMGFGSTSSAGGNPGMANMGAGGVGQMGLSGMPRRLAMSIPATSQQQHQHASQAHTAAQAAATAINGGQAAPTPPTSFLGGQMHNSPASAGPSPSPGQQASQPPQPQLGVSAQPQQQQRYGFQPQPTPFTQTRSPAMTTNGMGLPGLAPGAGNVATSFPFSQPAASTSQIASVGMGLAPQQPSHPTVDAFGRSQQLQPQQPPKGISASPAHSGPSSSPALSMMPGPQQTPAGNTPAAGRSTPRLSAAGTRPGQASQPPPATYATMTSSYSEAPTSEPAGRSGGTAVPSNMPSLAGRTFPHPFGDDLSSEINAAAAMSGDPTAGPSGSRHATTQEATATSRPQNAGASPNATVPPTMGAGPRPAIDVAARLYGPTGFAGSGSALGGPAARRAMMATNEAMNADRRAAGPPSSHHGRRTFFHTCLYDYLLRCGMADVAAAFLKTGVELDLVGQPEGTTGPAAAPASASGSSPNNNSTGTGGSATGPAVGLGVTSEPMPHDRTASSGSGSQGEQAAQAQRTRDPTAPSAPSTSSSPSRSSPPSHRGLPALPPFPGGTAAGAYLLSNGVGSATEQALNALPKPNLIREAPEGLLYEWWCVFWDVWRAMKGNSNGRLPASPAAQAYVNSQLAHQAGGRPSDASPNPEHGALARSRREGFIELGQDGKPITQEALMAEKNRQIAAQQREKQLFQAGKLGGMTAGMSFLGGRGPPGPSASSTTPQAPSSMFATALPTAAKEGSYAGGQQGVLERQMALNRASGRNGSMASAVEQPAQPNGIVPAALPAQKPSRPPSRTSAGHASPAAAPVVPSLPMQSSRGSINADGSPGSSYNPGGVRKEGPGSDESDGRGTKKMRVAKDGPVVSKVSPKMDDGGRKDAPAGFNPTVGADMSAAGPHSRAISGASYRLNANGAPGGRPTNGAPAMSVAGGSMDGVGMMQRNASLAEGSMPPPSRAASAAFQFSSLPQAGDHHSPMVQQSPLLQRPPSTTGSGAPTPVPPHQAQMSGPESAGQAPQRPRSSQAVAGSMPPPSAATTKALQQSKTSPPSNVGVTESVPTTSQPAANGDIAVVDDHLSFLDWGAEDSGESSMPDGGGTLSRLNASSPSGGMDGDISVPQNDPSLADIFGVDASFGDASKDLFRPEDWTSFINY